nr:MAG: capsid protein [Cressdnaviricota sp.]
MWPKRRRPKVQAWRNPPKYSKKKIYQLHQVQQFNPIIEQINPFIAKRTIGRFPAMLTSSKGEVKSVDLLAAGYAINTTGTVAALNLMAAGSSYFNRIGRKLEMKSLQINGFLAPITANNQTVSGQGRILIVYDRQPNGALPVWADVIKSQTQASATTSSTINDFINLDNRDRFQILRDVKFTTPSVTRNVGTDTFTGYPTNSTTLDCKENTGEFDMFIKLKGLVTHYKADSAPGVIGDIATGALLILTWGTFGSGSEGWQPLLAFRLRYKDN